MLNAFADCFFNLIFQGGDYIPQELEFVKSEVIPCFSSILKQLKTHHEKSTHDAFLKI